VYAGVRRLLFCPTYGHVAVHFVQDSSRISALVAVTVAVRLQIAVSWSPLSTAAKVMPR
jgi:hypothetical protein